MVAVWVYTLEWVRLGAHSSFLSFVFFFQFYFDVRAHFLAVPSLFHFENCMRCVFLCRLTSMPRLSYIRKCAQSANDGIFALIAKGNWNDFLDDCAVVSDWNAHVRRIYNEPIAFVSLHFSFPFFFFPFFILCALGPNG